MAQLTNSFETGLADGTVITVANSDDGSAGDALGAVQIDTGAAVEFDTATAAHGTRSARCATGGTAGQAYMQWFSTVSGTTLWLRGYVYLPATLSANTNILRLMIGTGTIIATVRVNTTNKLAFLYSSGTLGGTSTNSVNIGSWFRVEVKAVASLTVGSVEVRLYNTPDSATATETLSISNVNTGSGSAMNRARFGILSSVASTVVQVDDVVWTDVGWPGPVSTVVSGTGSLSATGALAGSGAKVIRYTWDVSTEGWGGEGATTVSRVTTPTHDGAGALSATKTLGAGSDSLRFNDGSGVRDVEDGGPTLTAWALVPAAAPGTGWQGRIEVQNAAFSWNFGPLTDLVPGTWAKLVYTPPAGLLADCRSLGFQVSVTGASAAVAVVVDTVTQGPQFALGAGTLTGAGSASGAGGKSGSGTGAVAATASLAGTGEPAAPALSGTGALSATGVLSGLGAKATQGSSSTTAAGTLASTGVRAAAGSAAATASSTSSGTGTRISVGTSTVPTAGALAGTGVRHAAGTGTASSSTSVAGQGARTGTGSATLAGTATLAAGAGAKNATGAGSTAAASAVPAGTGTHAGAGPGTVAATAVLTGAGSGAAEHTGSGSVEPSGALSGAGASARTGAGTTLTGAASIAGAGVKAGAGSTGLHPTASVDGAGRAARSGTAALAGTGATDGTGTAAHRGSGSTAATGTLTGGGPATRGGNGTTAADVALAAAGTATRYGYVVLPSTPALAGDGTKTGAGSGTAGGASGVGSLPVGSGTLLAVAVVTSTGSGRPPGGGDLNPYTSADGLVASTLAGPSHAASTSAAALAPATGADGLTASTAPPSLTTSSSP